MMCGNTISARFQHSADRNWSLQVRLAAMLHDVSKPETRRWSKEKDDWTFYGHDVVGGRVARAVLTRLKYPKEIVENVSKLVRYHLFSAILKKLRLAQCGESFLMSVPNSSGT